MSEQSTKDLANQISGANEGDTPIEAFLQTDEKVIARITDGIYRQPSSALRELISNSYDADATNVQIETDFPRYSEITIRDNGHGMGPKALANLIEHIGGSAKRNSHGIDLGVTNESDPNLTKLGRKLIGKIGIGLFSVAQLTQQFKIITKRKNDDYRLIAEVTLNTFSEEYLTNSQKNDEEITFESGKVRITKVKALDIEAHGTDIVLFNLRKNALSILKSEEMWSRVDEAEKPNQKKEYQPSYHIGRFTKNDNGELIETIDMVLPWDNDILPTERFLSIYKSLLNEVDHSRSTPRLDNTFDNYFQTIWNLALSSPIEYIYKHPFELNNEDNIFYYELANDKSVKPKTITFHDNENYHQIKNTSIPQYDPVGGFEVFIDGIKLYRPIAFTDQKKSENALQTPLMFYGSYSPNLDKYDNKLSGGPLRFEAYFFWNSKILPLDHNGIMIRINGASGTLYDPRWLGYPVAEKTTLGQITAEIYVLDGMDSALNIDRESFNYSHPHYQILSQWLHNALRQITAEQKKLRAERVKDNKQKITTKHIEGLLKTSSAELINNSSISLIEFENEEAKVIENRERGFTSFVYPECMNPTDIIQVEKIKLIFGILQAKGLLENLSYSEQNELIESFAEVLFYKDN